MDPFVFSYAIPMRLMKRSPTYAVFRGALVRALAHVAPEVEASRRDSHSVERYLWAHCDPVAWVAYRRQVDLPFARVLMRKHDALTSKRRR